MHNSVYLVWFEIGRIEYLERFAGGYPKLRAQGVEAVVLEAHVRYRKPARFDDRLLIRVRTGEPRGVRFRFEYRIERDGDLLVDGWTDHATVDATTMKAIRVPEWLEEALLPTAGERAQASSPSSS